MIGSMIVMQYASKFTELSRFIPEFVASEWIKMRRFEEGLALYIQCQLTGQPIHTYQDLYEQVKSMLKAMNLNSNNENRKWAD